MKIYKFRDFRSRDYLADILKKERLFCARYQDLNDPFEGILNISSGMRRIKRLDEEKTIETYLEDRALKPVFRDGWERIIDYNLLSVLDPNHDRTRVCSLSKSVTDVRL